MNKFYYRKQKYLKLLNLPFEPSKINNIESTHLLFRFLHNEILEKIKLTQFIGANVFPELNEIYDLMNGIKNKLSCNKYSSTLTVQNLTKILSLEYPLIKIVQSGLIQTTQLSLDGDIPYLLVVQCERKNTIVI